MSIIPYGAAILYNPLGWVPPGASFAAYFTTNQYYSGIGYPTFLSLPGVSFTRASTDNALNTSGSYVPFASGVPAITDLGLQVEGAATNGIRNPRAEGGSAIADPTYWSVITAAGLTITPVGRSTINGVEGMAYDISGTPSGGGASAISTETSGTIAAASGDVFTLSPFVAILSGSASGVAAIFNRANWTGAGTTDGTDFKANLNNVPARFVTSLTAPVGTTALVPRIIVQTTVGVSVNLRLWIGWPQAVKQAFVSSPILPAVGSPAASTRAEDGATITGSVIPPGFKYKFRLNSLLSSGNQTIAQWDDGTANNRVQLYVLSSDATLRLKMVTAGVDQLGADGLSLGVVAAGVTYTVAGRLQATGAGISLNGGAAVTSAAITLPAVTIFRFGKYISLNNLYGRLLQSIWLRYGPSNTELAGLST